MKGNLSELIQAGKNTWFMKGRVNVGFYLQSDNNIYVIDTGDEPETGKKISNIIDERGWNLKGILITHGHEDHTAGNRYLQERYGCPIFADAEDAVTVNYPEIGEAEYYGGKPYRELLVPGLKMSEKSICFDFEHDDFPKEVRVMKLPGHSRGNSAFTMPDGTMFTGDTTFIPDRKGRYLSYNYDMAGTVLSLKKIRDAKASIYIPGHGDEMYDITSTVDSNLAAIESLKNTILNLPIGDFTYDELIVIVSKAYGIKSGFGTYYLMSFIIRAFLNWMKDENLLEVSVEDYRLVWRKKTK